MELQHLEDDDGSEADVIILRELAEQEKKCIGSLLEIWVRTGEVLSARKMKCPRGTWRPWLRRHTSYTDDAAERYMLILKNADKLRAHAKTAPVRFLSDALLIAKENDPETRAALVEESNKTGKSVRSIVQARHKTSKLGAPPDPDAPEKKPLVDAAEGNTKDEILALGPEWTEKIKRLDAETVANLDKQRARWDAQIGHMRSRETWLEEIQRLLKRCQESVSEEDWQWISKNLGRDAGRLVDAAEGNTEAEFIENVLRQHGQEKFNSQGLATPKPPGAPAKPELSEFGDLNNIGTFDSITIKLELTPTEFKILNRGLNTATPINEKEICAVKFLHSYNTRYTAIKQG
jgi:hypothetical protein